MSSISLGDQVVIKLSNRTGKVVGLANYTFKPSAYYVEFLNGVGDAARDWFEETEVVLA